MDDIDHEFTMNAVCPWCGHEDLDSWEYHMEDGDSLDTECGECEKEFTIEMSITIDYSTTKKKAE